MDTAQSHSFKRDTILTLLGLAGIIIFIVATSPAKLSVVLLLALPVLVASTVYVATRLFLGLFTSLGKASLKVYSSVVSVGLMLVMMLGSLGQLGSQDILLALLLVGGLVFYLKRTQSV